MADRTIGELPVSPGLDDESLLVVEQQGQARSIQGALIKKFATVAVQGAVDAAQQAAQQAGQSAVTAGDAANRAEAAAEAAETDRQALAQAVASAQQSASAAAESAGEAADGATLAESWAVGGTGTRGGEDTNNAAYWASKAQAEADRATVPAVSGVYNIILTDTVTQDRYALIVENGTIQLLGVSPTLEATDMTLVDSKTGISYALVIENGALFLQEVA